MENKKRIIRIIGANEHNLKNISVDIPKEKFTVITGPSGSGKSSLALDVLYTEGKRRYVESLSSYARQFLGIPKKPDVDRIDGICPAIAIEQKTVGHNPRSTVGTITEISDYFRVLFTRIGTVLCTKCSAQVQQASTDSITQAMLNEYQGIEIQITAPIAVHRKGTFTQEIESFVKEGYYRYIIDKHKYTFRTIDEVNKLELSKNLYHTIEIVLDQLIASDEEAPRLRDDVERACTLASDICGVRTKDKVRTWTKKLACIPCGLSYSQPEPRLLSFNSPIGACQDCSGLGTVTRWEFLYGNRTRTCETCNGKRLNQEALAVRIEHSTIHDIGEMSVKQVSTWMSNLSLTSAEMRLVEPLILEIQSRLRFLLDVGIGYLTLNRTARTLSGGESQRIRLATQIGSALSGVLYVLDEPSIGLHPRDHDQLIKTLKRLCSLANTVVVVEHDRETILSADHVIDMGPAAGINGGQIVATGTPDEIMAAPASITGAYLSGRKNIRRTIPLRTAEDILTVKNCTRNNLKGIDVKIPLGVFNVICGVSGSGKSTFGLGDLPQAFYHSTDDRRATREDTTAELMGGDKIRDLVIVDQAPIGRTPRSTPATYLGIFNMIRELYASLPEANARGYTVGHFSYNVNKGRCAECSGDGQVTVSMYYLPDVVNECHVCKGKRYTSEILDITYKGKSIADVLDMDAREATEFFASHSRIHKRVNLLCDVGLAYLKLGQPSPTLSGGESQRLKLVTELAKKGARTLYILDEPTTGLGAPDVAKLLEVLNRLVDRGNTVIVVEHNQYVLENADYIIELGPEGGDEGGQLIAAGTPEQLAKNKQSPTGRYLAKWLIR